MQSVKEEYWKDWSSTKKTKAGLPMPEAWSEPAWDVFVMFGPRGRAFPKFCPGGVAQSNNGINTSRQTARERDAQTKKAKREEDRSQENVPPVSAPTQPSATAAALQSHTQMMGLKLLLQFGSVAAKQKAVEQLERQVLGAIENLPQETSSTAPSIYSVAETPTSPQLLPSEVPLSAPFRFM